MFAHLVNFHWGTFAVFGVWRCGAFFTQNGDAEVLDFTVDLAKSGLGKLVWRRKIFLEARYALQGAINLLAR